MSNIIDSFFVSLGFKTDTTGLKEMTANAEAARETMLSVGTALKAFAVGAIVKGIADIGSAWESNRIQIAGYFDALGQSSNFNEGLKDADEALNLITIAAAKLPGEAEEYQEVFKDTFTFVKGAVGGSIQQMTEFTDTLTAIGKAGKIDAAQIGRETNELLAAGQGRAMGRNRLWMQLFPLMRKLDGQAKLTAQSFNAMTEVQRADLMKRAFAGLQPMLDASANSFDAMWGAMKSGVKILIRLGTSGLFEGMKKGLNSLNALFFDSNGKITVLGQKIVDTFKTIGSVIIQIIDDVVEMGTAFAKMTYAGLELEAILGAIAVGLFGLQIAFVLVTDDLWTFINGGESLTGLLVSKWKPAIYGIIAAFGLLALAIFGPTIVAMALVVIGAVALASKWDDVVERMRGTWEDFTDGVKNFFVGEGGFLLPGLKIFDSQEERTAKHVAARAARSAEREQRNAGRVAEVRQKELASGTDTSGGMSVPIETPSVALAGVSSYDPRQIGSGFGATSDVDPRLYQRSSGRPMSSTVADYSTNIHTVNVQANNVSEMHRELDKHKRVIRSGQSPVGL